MLDCLNVGHASSEGIARVLKDLIRNVKLTQFYVHHVDPFVNTFLIKSYCLSLYGASIWSLGAKLIRQLEIGFNKILRKIIWYLPRNSQIAEEEKDD